MTAIRVRMIMTLSLSLQEIAGLLQKIMVGIILLWTELFAIRLFRLEGKG